MVRGAYGGLKMVLSQGHCPPPLPLPSCSAGWGTNVDYGERTTYCVLCTIMQVAWVAYGNTGLRRIVFSELNASNINDLDDMTKIRKQAR